jgi:environmental stress-induced protein Ves
MRVLRSVDHKRMPWKNGKGETVEIAVSPPAPGATVDNFDWRISMATVAEDGPFSVFGGIDRTLSVLTGEGITLSVAGHAPTTLRRETPPYGFPADRETSATLVSGPITDLNVMSRRGAFTHAVERVVTQKLALQPSAVMRIVLTLNDVSVMREDIRLQPLDALFLEAGETARLSSASPATIYVVQIEGINT